MKGGRETTLELLIRKYHKTRTHICNNTNVYFISAKTPTDTISVIAIEAGLIYRQVVWLARDVKDALKLGHFDPILNKSGTF